MITLSIDLDRFNHFKLCFVSDGVCFFTTQPVVNQWGDDWDDAPYQFNAGPPYAPSVHHYQDGSKKLSPQDWLEDGSPRYQLLKLHFAQGEHRILGPADLWDKENDHLQWVSVQDINAGSLPWLCAQRMHPKTGYYESRGEICAGATPATVRAFIKRAGGEILSPESGLKPYPEAMPGVAFFAPAHKKQA